MRAINELKPVLGLELTATPFVETSQGRGAVQECHLRLPAWQGDGGRLRQGAGGRDAEELQPDRHVRRRRLKRLKLEDGVRLHERREGGAGNLRARDRQHIVKPFVLVIARDTTHAGAAAEA